MAPETAEDRYFNVKNFAENRESDNCESWLYATNSKNMCFSRYTITPFDHGVFI